MEFKAMPKRDPDDPRPCEPKLPTTDARTSEILKHDSCDASAVASRGQHAAAASRCHIVNSDDCGKVTHPPYLNDQSIHTVTLTQDDRAETTPMSIPRSSTIEGHERKSWFPVKPNHVCFGWTSHPSTAKWLAAVKLFSDDDADVFPERTNTTIINAVPSSSSKHHHESSGHDCFGNHAPHSLSTAVTDEPGLVRSKQDVMHPNISPFAHPSKKFCRNSHSPPESLDPELGTQKRSGTLNNENGIQPAVLPPDKTANKHVHSIVERPSSKGSEHEGDKAGNRLGDNYRGSTHELSQLQVLGGGFPGHGGISDNHELDTLYESGMVAPSLLERDTSSTLVPRVAGDNQDMAASSTRDDDDVQQELTLSRTATNEQGTNGEEPRGSPNAPDTTTTLIALAPQLIAGRAPWKGPQNATDIYFGMHGCPGTARCRGVVQTFFTNRDEWQVAMADAIKCELLANGPVDFFVFLDTKTGMPCHIIRDGLWFKATDEEFVSNIKTMFDNQRLT